MSPLHLKDLSPKNTPEDTQEHPSPQDKLRTMMQRHATKLKQWVKAYLCLEDTVTILIAQRQCPDPGCEDMETLLGVLFPTDFERPSPSQEVCQIIIKTPMLDLGYKDITHWAEVMVKDWPQGCLLPFEARQAQDPLARFFMPSPSTLPPEDTHAP